MIRNSLPDTIKNIPAVLRNISAGKTVLIWALAIIAGILIFFFVSTGHKGKQVTLVFASWWEDELNEAVLEKLTGEYMAENPGITVKFEKMSWEEILELLEGKNSGETGKNAQKHNPPDIFSIDPYAINYLENRSILAVPGENKDPSANVVSIISFINPLYYNIDLLEQAGFDRPPKNQTEFLSYVQRLKETGVNGTGLALGDPRNVSRQILSWIWTAAGSPPASSPPASSPSASSPPAGETPVSSASGGLSQWSFTSKEVIDTLTFLNQLKQSLYANPFELSEAELLDAFGRGSVGMMIGSIADVRELNTKKINFSITTIPSPVSYSKKPVFPLTFWYAGISSKSEFPDEAKDFLSFLVKNSALIAEAAYAVPGNGTVNRELQKNDPFYAKAFDMYEAGEMVRDVYNFQNWSRLNIIIHREIELMFQGAKTPQQCAEAIQHDWDRPGRIASSVP